MPSFEKGNVVRVPFPYTDRARRQFRPALVISDGCVGENNTLIWVVMITSASNRSWPGDLQFGDRYAEAGLPSPSVIRTAKIVTIDARDGGLIGTIWPELLAEADRNSLSNLGLLS